MSTVLLLAFAPIFLLLILGAFFAGSETALTAVSRGRMHTLEKEGSRAARDVNFLTEDRERMVGALLLGNTFVNILASSLATTVLESSFGPETVYVATAIMTVLILFFVEVLPKTLAIARTDRFALTVATPVRLVVGVLAPIVNAVQFLVWRVLALFGVHENEMEEIAAHEEIRGTVEIHHKEGSVEREHRDMLAGVLDLRELTVADVMIHRKNIATIDASLPREEMLQEVLDANHTRIPLWRDQPENIVGIVHSKDVVRAIIERGRTGIDVASLATPPWFVPETTSLEEMLTLFREQRTHFALVVDEYGALQGLIALEDILEEIFGDLPDEHEEPERPDVRKRSDGSYLIDGSVPIRELNRDLDWNLPDEEATTIAGLVIHEARTIPEVGQRFAFFGFQFEILRRQRNQITALRVIPPAKSAEPLAASVPAKPQQA
ncbi:MAG: HlyC/CorC family transporter [Alphaproteobacteria bacterium]|nr:HlyC/CorC family transporter [Alphaproteobacteria bacterium]MBL6936388.1 HlyC/CorC family transporter [Alphaproteobacteria bacterium]MBL7098561.1 HlyC/CorC family transporter [Alphaproteobacteria bacterium]